MILKRKIKKHVSSKLILMLPVFLHLNDLICLYNIISYNN